MSEQAERVWLERMDWLEEEEMRIRVEGIDLSSSMAEDPGVLKRIKENAFAKLGLPTMPIPNPPARSFRTGRIRWMAAGLAGAVLFFTIADGSPDVRAQLRKAIQFLPGFGAVEDSQQLALSYALEAPITKDIGGKQLEIRGLTIGPATSLATLTGSKGLPRVSSFTLSNGQGDRYVFHYGMVSESGDWTGTYSFIGAVRVAGKMELSFAFDGQTVKIPLTLGAIQQADRVEELGVTDTHHGVSLTAVVKPMTVAGAPRTDVTLIPQLPAEVRIDSYGFSEYDHLQKPVLLAASGENLQIEQAAVFPNPNEFVFQSGEAGPNRYRLEIPELSLVRQTAKRESFEIPIPREGTLELNRTIDLMGFPVELLRVERLPAGTEPMGKPAIRLFVDCHDDPSAAESFRYFLPDTASNPELSGFGFRVDEQTRAMTQIDLNIAEGQTSYRVFVKEVHTVIRGPWVLPLLEPEASLESEERSPRPPFATP